MSVRAWPFLSHSENASVSLKIVFYQEILGNNDHRQGVRNCRGRVSVFPNILK